MKIELKNQKIYLDSAWDIFVQFISREVELEGAIYQAFWTRFRIEHIARFTEGRVEQVFAELFPNDSYRNHQTYMGGVFRQFEKYYGIDLGTRRGKALRLLELLVGEYRRWKIGLGIPSAMHGSECFQLHELLRVLDCNVQEGHFREAIKSFKPAGGFFLRADTRPVQQWLVDRLSHSIPSIESADVVPIDVAPSWRREFLAFERILATQLNLPADTAIDETIAQICDRCQTKPFVMAIYGVRRLPETVFNDLMAKFWQPLVRKTEGSPSALTTTVVLFLTDEIKYQCPGTVPQFDSQSPDRIVELPPLKSIGTDDVRLWLKRDGVRSLLQGQAKAQCEEALRCVVPKTGSRSNEWPEDTLNDICWLFGLEEGIAAIEKYWKLVG